MKLSEVLAVSGFSSQTDDQYTEKKRCDFSIELGLMTPYLLDHHVKMGLPL